MALADMVTSPQQRARYESAGSWDAVTLAGQVAFHAASAPANVAVIDENGALSYGDLAASAASLASHLAARGVGLGDVVSVQLPNWHETVIAAVAVVSLGAVINPLLPNYRARELTHVFRTATPKAIFIPSTYRGFDHRALVAEVAAATGVHPLAVVARGEAVGGSVAFDGLVERQESLGGGRAAGEVSELIFTSGTEAQPKAIMHTEQTANFSVRAAQRDLGLSDADVVWMPSPIGHSTGFNYGVRFALYHGLQLVLQDRWDAAVALELLDATGGSYTLAATTFLEDLVHAARRDGRRVETMTHFGCGGSPVPAPLVDAAGEVGIGVLRLYGSTEALVATWNRRESPLPARRDTDGCPISGVEIIVTDDGGTPLRAGQAGEIRVRGPNTCVGFAHDPERTAAAFGPGGWMRSGDLGVLDEWGYLSIVGRKKEIIIRGGINIAPREIEDLIAVFPEVQRVAVIGLPDPRLGERMCACVVLHEGALLELADVTTRLRDQGLATYKLPERLEILDALPSTASGKIQKHELLRALA